MRSAEFQKVCQAVSSGEQTFVKHVVLHQIGRVLNCHEDEVEVDVNGIHKTWSKENCVEAKKH